MAVINTNVKALHTQYALKNSARAQTVAMEQLSSGKRINSARDDAAGMAIAKRMSQQIRSLDMAIRNAGDAVALIQTAEGATGTITDMLQRMRELAIQAMNDTNAQDQRGYLDLEFQQLKQQIVTIADHTQWNGFSILNGTVGERVGDRPVYKVTSSGVGFENITFTKGTPTTNDADNQVATGGTGVFTKAGQLQVTFGGGTTAITSATFTLPDGNVVNLDAANTNVIAFTGNVITLKAGSGLVSGDVTLIQTTPERTIDLTGTAVVEGASYSITVDNTPFTYVAQPGDNLEAIATGLALAINGNSAFTAENTGPNNVINITAGAGRVDISALSATPAVVTVASEVNDVQTNVTDERTIDLTGTAVVEGASYSITVDNTPFTYVAQPGDNLEAIATGLALAINGNSAFTAENTGPNNVINITAGAGRVDISALSATPAAVTVASTVGVSVQTDANYASGNTISLNVSRNIPIVEAMQPNDIIINGITIPASSALYDEVSTGGSVAASAISRAAAINLESNATGVMAVVNVNTMTGSAMVAGAKVSGTISINGFTTPQITTIENNSRESRAAVVNAINSISEQTGVVAINSGSDSEGIRLEARDGRNIEVAFNSAASDTTFSQRTGIRQGLQIGSYSLESTVEGPVVVTTTPTTNWTRAGLRPGDYSQNLSAYTTELRPVVMPPVGSALPAIKSLGDGDLVINGVPIRGARALDDSVSSTVAATSSRIASAIATALAINDSSSLTGVTATALPATTTSSAAPTNTTSGSHNIYLNGVAVNVTLVANESTTDRLNNIIDAVNAQRGQHGVKAEATNDGRLVLSTPDGRNLSVWFDSTLPTTAAELGLLGSDATPIPGANAASTGAATVYGSIALRSEKAFTLAPGINGFNSEGDFKSLGFQQGTFGGTVNEADSKMTPPRTGRLTFHVGAAASQTVHIDFADYGAKGPITGAITGDVHLWDKETRINRIDNSESARAMLGKLDVALDKVNGNRAVMGAVMNRLDYIMENLTNVSMNTSASRSQIEDADYAKASTELARTGIMQQAATAVLAQANMDQQTVLKLLQ